MPKTIFQVYQDNPITTNESQDLMYFGRSPYGLGDDTAMQFSDFAAQFGAPYTPSALTATPDTNVTITLGGNPTTALLNAASITLGWTGQLSPSRGGTGVDNGSSTLTLGGNLTTSGAFNSTFTMTGGTSVTFPTTGTLATTAQIPSVTPSALTKTDDSNVTLTLGGTPATALLQPTSLTLGWTGQLPVSRGGTGLSTLTNNGILVATSTSTFGQVPPSASSVMVTNPSGVPSFVTTLPDGLNLGTPSALTLTNALGLPVGGIAATGTPSATTYLRGDSTWSNPLTGSGGLKSFQVFTSGTSATYTKPAGITSIMVELIGGGGAGGGATGNPTGGSFGAGGGSGGYTVLYIASAASTYTYTVGAGGTGVSASTGNSGSATTFSTASAGGGVGGASMVSVPTANSLAATGGDGGAASGGNVLNIVGRPGGSAFTALGNGFTGVGGSSVYGTGAKSKSSVGNGTGGQGFGAGGGGAVSTTASTSGGSGADGIIIVWEYS